MSVTRRVAGGSRAPFAPLLRGALLIGALTGACAVAPRRPGPVPAGPSTVAVELEERIAAALMRHAVEDPVFAPARSHVQEALRGVLGTSREVAEVNEPYRRGPVFAYLVDAVGAASDPAACGAWGSSFDIPVAQRDACYRLRSLRWNCAVLSESIVACDVRLLWRLNRYASLLAIASLKKPGVEEYYFPRAEVRRTFLGGEATFDGIGKMLENLRAIDGSFANAFRDVQGTRDLVYRGFLAFVLSHEAGHVLHGHAAGNSLPPCAFGFGVDAAAVALRRLCMPPSDVEAVADREAVRYLSGDLSPSAYTPARAAPELFIEEHERRRLDALQAVGLADTWRPETASPEERSRFTEAWWGSMATGSHPKDLQRYLLLLEALERKGVPLEASKVSAQIAREELLAIEAHCRSASSRSK